jgi:hypothetical protein
MGDHAVRQACGHRPGREALPPRPRRRGELTGLVLEVLAQAGHPLTTREVLDRLRAAGAARLPTPPCGPFCPACTPRASPAGPAPAGPTRMRHRPARLSSPRSECTGC